VAAEATILLVVPPTVILQVNQANRTSIKTDRLQVATTVDKKDTSHISVQRRIKKGIQIPQDPAIRIGEGIIKI